MEVGSRFHLDQHDRADVVQREIAHTETHYVFGHQTTLNATLLTCVICHDLSEHQSPAGTGKVWKRRERRDGSQIHVARVNKLLPSDSRQITLVHPWSMYIQIRSINERPILGLLWARCT